MSALQWNSEGRIGIDPSYQGENATLGLPYWVYRKDGTAVYHLCAQPCNLCGPDSGVDVYVPGTDFANLEEEHRFPPVAFCAKYCLQVHSAHMDPITEKVYPEEEQQEL